MEQSTLELFTSNQVGNLSTSAPASAEVADESYGKFDTDHNEYVIFKYDTERPWINYISNGRYCSLISQTGGGYSFWKEPKQNRITKYRYDAHPQDRPGKYLYIKDLENDELWSNGWQPIMKTPDAWECRHGLGYTKISSAYSDIHTQTTYFVPKDDDCEVWMTVLKNNSQNTRVLKITPYVEFSLINASDEYAAYPNLRYFNDASFSEDLNAILYHIHFNWMEMGKIFFGSSEKITGYTVDRRAFLGAYGSETAPEVVLSGEDHNQPVFGSDCVGAPSFTIRLEPGEEKQFNMVIGVDKRDAENARRIIKKYSDFELAKAACLAVKKDWEALLSRFKVETPDSDVNTMMNIWNQYQNKVTFDWSRWASYYHTGTYRGIGFRDTSQDSLGALHILPEAVHQKIHLLAKNMFEDGHAYHCFFFDGTGDDKKYGDDHLWIINAVYAYINETGDLGILDEEAPYIEGSKGSIFDHCVRAVEYAFRESGPHGLPKMFFADWNDCLNNICLKEKGEKGESVMVAMQLVQFGNYLVEMAKWAGKADEVATISEKLAALKIRINEVTWDGDWYTRAYTDEGRAVGAKSSGEGQIFLNAQSWAVFSGVADQKRGVSCMDSVYDKLNSPYGIKLIDPPYRSFPLDIGSVIHYPEGIKENAGIFCHANTWAIIAETKLRRPERAFQYYRQILPPAVAKKIGYDKYRVEPYVYCQFITGPDHPNHGSASHSWLTGTAVWSFVAMSQYILGIRPTYHGLLIDPCVPANWSGYTVDRVFRGASYRITVSNRAGKSVGVSSLKLNGVTIEGALIPPQAEGSFSEVEVVIG